jgi:hypothetical protein
MAAHRTRLTVAAALVIAVLLGLVYRYKRSPPGSGVGGPPGRSGHGQQIVRSEMSAAEIKYGMAPTPDPSITYQPDVVIVGGGAGAIRSQSPNGFIWTIDASAPHAGELAPGKVFFVTNRAVGRVFDVRKEGGNLVVVVGPVNLQEVLREAHIVIDTPVDFGEAIPYTLADLPGRIDVIARADSGDAGTVVPVMFGGWQGAGGPPAQAPSTDVSNLVHFQVQPVANRFGFGLEVGADAGGLKLYATAAIHVAAPTAEGRIDVTPTGGFEGASLTLTGGGGLTWKFAAATNKGLRANVNGIIRPDTDFSIPLFAGGFPIALTVRQTLSVKTALGVRDTTLSATGVYSFSGAFTIGVVKNQWVTEAPMNFEATQNLMKGTEGLSMGAAGLDLADEIKVIAGIGAHGFVAGPYFRVTPAIGVFKGSSAGMIECKEATIDVKFSAGVGYVIPRVVENLINGILSALNIKYRIDGEGSIRAGKPKTLYNATNTMKGCNADKG